MSTPSDNISLSEVLSETKRILDANRKHFFILNLLFVFPFSVLLSIYPILFPIVPPLNSTLTTTTFLQILYLLISCVFFSFAIGTVTYSAFHGYYNRPLEITPTLKSLSSSFIPLASTLIFSLFTYFSVGLLIGILWDVLNIYLLDCFTWTISVVELMVFVCVIHLQVNWFISNVIVVVESKWGYESLRRSSYLMKGMRKIAMRMIMFFGVLSYIYLYNKYWSFSNTGLWQMIIVTTGMTMLMEYNLVAQVVLYINCMKKHCELAVEVQPEEYVSVLIDEDGNKLVNSVVTLKDDPVCFNPKDEPNSSNNNSVRLQPYVALCAIYAFLVFLQ